MFKVILTSVHKELAQAWEKHCGSLPCVQIHNGSILDVQCDAIVSPANSFGFMDGGIDSLYTKHFGDSLQDHLQFSIRRNYNGELPVGSAAIVMTGNKNIPYLIAAPTMRVPMILGAESVNPYLAARAALILVKHGNFYNGVPISDHVRTIAFPGLGTGVGGISPDVCAHQVKAAINKIILGENVFPGSWGDAQRAHQELYFSKSVRDLQFGEEHT